MAADGSSIQAVSVSVDVADVASPERIAQVRAEILARFKAGGVSHWERGLEVAASPAEALRYGVRDVSASVTFSAPSKRSLRRRVALERAICRAKSVRTIRRAHVPIGLDHRLLAQAIANVRERVGRVVSSDDIEKHLALRLCWIHADGVPEHNIVLHNDDLGFFATTTNKGPEWDFGVMGRFAGLVILQTLNFRAFGGDHRHALAMLLGKAVYFPKTLTQAALDELHARFAPKAVA